MTRKHPDLPGQPEGPEGRVRQHTGGPGSADFLQGAVRPVDQEERLVPAPPDVDVYLGDARPLRGVQLQSGVPGSPDMEPEEMTVFYIQPVCVGVSSGGQHELVVCFKGTTHSLNIALIMYTCSVYSRKI